MVPQSPIKNPMVSVERSIFSGDGIHWGGCPDSRVRASGKAKMTMMMMIND